MIGSRASFTPPTLISLTSSAAAMPADAMTASAARQDLRQDLETTLRMIYSSQLSVYLALCDEARVTATVDVIRPPHVGRCRAGTRGSTMYRNHNASAALYPPTGFRRQSAVTPLALIGPAHLAISFTTHSPRYSLERRS